MLNENFKYKIKTILIYVFFSTSILGYLSCSNFKNTETINKRYFYKLSQNDTIVLYALRDYTFVGDTIKEKTRVINKKKINLEKTNRTFIKNNNGLDIVIRNENKRVSTPYFYPLNINSCYTYFHPLHGNVELCYKGKVNFDKFKNVYKIEYVQKETDGISKVLYLDKDFTFIGISEIYGSSYDLDKEIRVSESDIPLEILKVLVPNVYY